MIYKNLKKIMKKKISISQLIKNFHKSLDIEIKKRYVYSQARSEKWKESYSAGDYDNSTEIYEGLRQEIEIHMEDLGLGFNPSIKA